MEDVFETIVKCLLLSILLAGAVGSWALIIGLSGHAMGIW